MSKYPKLKEQSFCKCCSNKYLALQTSDGGLFNQETEINIANDWQNYLDGKLPLEFLYDDLQRRAGELINNKPNLIPQGYIGCFDCKNKTHKDIPQNNEWMQIKLLINSHIFGDVSYLVWICNDCYIKRLNKKQKINNVKNFLCNTDTFVLLFLVFFIFILFIFII